jgi:hypothetical protein
MYKNFPEVAWPGGKKAERSRGMLGTMSCTGFQSEQANRLLKHSQVFVANLCLVPNCRSIKTLNDRKA